MDIHVAFRIASWKYLHILRHKFSPFHIPLLDSRVTDGPIKSLLSVSPPVLLSVRESVRHFSQEWVRNYGKILVLELWAKLLLANQVNIKVIYKVILSFWVCAARHTQNTQNEKFVHLCNISRKTWGIKLIFWQQINTKVFLIVSLCLCIARHTQSTLNNKFAIPLQYLKENVMDEVNFFAANKHERFLLIDTIILGVCG